MMQLYTTTVGHAIAISSKRDDDHDMTYAINPYTTHYVLDVIM